MVVPLIFLVRFSLTDTTVAHVHAGHHILPGWWESLDYVFLAVGFYAVFHAAGHAASKAVKKLLWLFWVCLAAAVVFHAHLHWLSYFASAGLIGTHLFNIRLHAGAIRHRKNQSEATSTVID